MMYNRIMQLANTKKAICFWRKRMTIIILWIFIISLLLGFIGWLITVGPIGKIIAGIIIVSALILAVFKIRGGC